MEVLCRRLARTKSKCFMPDAENVHFTPAVFLAGCFSSAPIQSYATVDSHRGPRIKLYVTSCDKEDNEDNTWSTTAHVHISMRSVSAFFRLFECLITVLNSYIAFICIRMFELKHKLQCNAALSTRILKYLKTVILNVVLRLYYWHTMHTAIHGPKFFLPTSLLEY
jgi:hypothetical protein